MEDGKETKKAEQTGGEDLAKRLEAMEELLRQQLEQNKKIAKHRSIMSLLMLCMVVVFGVGLFALNSTVAGATRELPQLIESTDASVQQLRTTLEDISKLDFEGVNKTVAEMGQDLSAVDFEALNDAVLDLQKAAEGLANLTSIFR